ncbi:MAG: acetolactate synthase catalytic subunit, partial [Thaumarchaeota archaeon]|nr:acetolactate synthase catalytic subunit [Nitrososphaerota archaeon]
MVEMSGSDALIEGLRREKVEAVFGMPGGANLPIYDSLYESGIRHVLVRHEQSAAHMADAYARVSRRAGVCMATSGPGATNLVTGIATAYMDSSPVIAITGQVPKTMIGRDAFQETDIMGVVASITKNSFQPLQSGDIPDAVKKAFFVATSGRPGPVVIDIPKDVQTDRAEMVFPEKVEIRGYKAHLALDHAEIERAAEILARAERPVLWGGGGVSISNASEQFQAIAELLMAPVITSLQGKGTFPEDHPLSLGPMGMHGRAESNKIVQECDALLAVGVRFSDRSTGTFSDFMPNGKIIHLDADPSEINKNKRVDVYVVGDAKQMLAEIYEALCRRFRQREAPYPWLDRVKEVREQLANIPAYAEAEHELSGPRIMKTLREVLPAK